MEDHLLPFGFRRVRQHGRYYRAYVTCALNDFGHESADARRAVAAGR